MLGKLFPLLLAFAGLGAGVGAGLALRPPPSDVAAEDVCGDTGAMAEAHAPEKSETDASATHDYVKLNNQFVVPVVEDGKVGSLVVMSLSVEVPTGQSETVYDREPKLRDAFLQVMFDHANTGGFGGSFTASTRMNVLRMALLEVAQKTLGASVSDVLIMDIVRQDI
jgi:hypothetical protein